MITETDKAYLAGLFDGEGCIGYYNRGTIKGKSYHSASVTISMTDLRPLDWLKKLVGYGKISFITKSGNRRNVYSWQLSNQTDIKDFLTMIRPFLKLKADQVDLLFELWEEESSFNRKLTPAIIDRREDLVRKMKELKRSHVVEGVETRRAGSF